MNESDSKITHSYTHTHITRDGERKKGKVERGLGSGLNSGVGCVFNCLIVWVEEKDGW